MNEENNAVTGRANAETVSPNLPRAYELLQRLLSSNDGVVSSKALKKELMTAFSIKTPDALELMKELKVLDGHAANGIGVPDAKTYHRGWNFYSREEYDQVIADEANRTEADAATSPPPEDEPEPQKNRQEEARLGTYVKAFLEGIYESVFVPDGTPYVFDVHKVHIPGSRSYENVDIIAVHWRSGGHWHSDQIVDLVTVEVKLDFSPKAVHQGCNYMRFSNRVWVAAVVPGDVAGAALALRRQNPGLFEYAVAQGLGIITCRLAQGRKYECAAIHWPKWNSPEPLEKDRFMERYLSTFEDAGVKQRATPKVRF